MEEFVKEITDQLACKTVFKIPFFGTEIPITESVVVTWIIMAFFFVMCLIFVRNLKVENPGRTQVKLELIVTKLFGIAEGILGEHGKRYAPYIVSVLLYLAFANLIGILGFKPPTKDINVTATLGLMSIVLIEFAGIRAKGIKKWGKGFAEPVALVLPFNILEIFIRPLSLCMRLFGNILGGFVIMELLKFVVPILVPAVLSFYFDLFDGLIQAYVFVFLTSLFMREAME